MELVFRPVLNSNLDKIDALGTNEITYTPVATNEPGKVTTEGYYFILGSIVFLYNKLTLTGKLNDNLDIELPVDAQNTSLIEFRVEFINNSINSNILWGFTRIPTGQRYQIQLSAANDDLNDWSHFPLKNDVANISGSEFNVTGEYIRA